MSAEFSRSLLSKVLEQSRQSIVSWSDTVAPNSYRCRLGDYRIRITADIDKHAATFFVARIMTLSSDLIDTFDEDQSLLRELFAIATGDSDFSLDSLTGPSLERIQRSPFVVGSPIARDEDFIGRESQRTLARDSVELGQSIQILGERRMGKTSFLLWLKRNTSMWQDYPVAFVWAQGRAGRSPAAFVEGVAEGLGRGEEVKGLLRGDTETPEQALERLLPAVLLVDEAANLAEPKHGFDNDFLNTLRTFGQRRQMIWISASHLDLRKLFFSRGLTSMFLNDARLMYVGQLEEEEALDLLRPLEDPEATEIALENAGGFACGLQWLADRLIREKIERKTALADYVSAMEQTFKLWWNHRKETEKRLLQRSLVGLKTDDLSRIELRQARELRHLGLLAEREDSFVLPGQGWCSFVEGLTADTASDLSQHDETKME